MKIICCGQRALLHTLHESEHLVGWLWKKRWVKFCTGVYHCKVCGEFIHRDITPEESRVSIAAAMEFRKRADRFRACNLYVGNY